MEQPVWNSATTINIPPGGSFWVSIPALSQGGPNDPGGLAQITTAGKVVSTVSFDKLPGLSSGGCSPTGLAVGAGGNMLVGCGNVGTQAILLDKNGNFIKFVGLGALGGTDEIWYDPTSNKWYVTGNNGTNNSRFFDIVDANGNILQQVNLPTTPSAHSITVDPFNGDVFVALAGGDGNTFCPNGCIDVFHNAASVPGPILGSGIPGIIAALGLLVFGRRRWQKRFAA
jgi:DNA-binding beta-propeller fold protein YncE